MFTGKNLKDSVIEGKYYHLKEDKDMQIRDTWIQLLSMKRKAEN